MRTHTICIALAALLILTGRVQSQEPLDVAAAYQRIAADYQTIAATARDVGAREAAGRLTRDAYRELIRRAVGLENLSDDDLHALGLCHEALGEADKAKQRFSASLAKTPLARTHLSLVRVNLSSDLAAAEKHFAQAVALDAQLPALIRFRLLLALANSRQGDWAVAAAHLEAYLGYTKTLSDRAPANAALRGQHAAVAEQLDRLRRLAALQGESVPAIKAEHWIQGEAGDLANLKGKVVLVDFWGMWADPSRQRVEQLKMLHAEYADRGLKIVGLTLAYHHRWDDATDEVTYDDQLTVDAEAAGAAAYADKHDVPWPLAIVDQSLLEDFAVSTLPHTVAIDRQGQVQLIVLGGDTDGERLKKTIERLLSGS